VLKTQICHFTFSAVDKEMVMFADGKKKLPSEHLLLSKLKEAHGGKVRKAARRERGCEASKSSCGCCDAALAAPRFQSCLKGLTSQI